MGPDPISTLKFEPSPVRVRHLANTSAENSAESPLYFDQSQNSTCKQSQIFPPNCQNRINQNLPDSNFPINSISEQFSKVHGFSGKISTTLPDFEAWRLRVARWWILCTSTTWGRKTSLGRHAVHPSRKLAKSGDYDQPVPPADSSVTPSQLESLWQDAGDRSQPDPQSWQVSGTQSQPSRNPGRSRDT
ncbi:hypothetical protein Prudu_000440, partial [Prunus dulcis]